MFKQFSAIGRLIRSRLETLDPIILMLPMGGLIGWISAWVVQSFHLAMASLIHLYSDYDSLVTSAAHLSFWQRILIPFFAATIAGVIMWFTSRWVTLNRGPEYMEAIRIGDGRLPFIPNLLRSGASLIAVSGGITIGREGSMIQLAALCSSACGRVLRISCECRRLLVACGAAAGFAAAYHAPIAGTLFVAEIVLGGLLLRESAALLVAAVTSELTTQSLLGSGPLYLTKIIGQVHFSDAFDGLFIGAAAGLIGPCFLWLLEITRNYYQTWFSFIPLRMAIAGLLIGLFSALRSEVWGNGFSTVQSLLTNHWELSTLAFVCLLRLMGLCVASAAKIPGGVLTPTLMLGGGLGLFVAHYFFSSTISHVNVLWVLVGMGSLLAATTHAPAMSAIMMFEITREYDIILAVMPACVVSAVIGNLLHKRSVYSEALGEKCRGDEAVLPASQG